MTMEELRERLPEYARDIRQNLGSLTSTTSLTEQQLYGAVLAAAIASRDVLVQRVLVAEAAAHLKPEAVAAAKSAAAIMAMNNVYYRSLHLLDIPEYRTMPARLRMNVIANPGVDKLDFEFWCLVVSAVNGCGDCLTSHEKVVRAAGASREMVQDGLRIAAIVHAAAVTVESESVLAGEA